MPDLSFEVEGVKVVRFAVAPQLSLRLRVTNAAAEEVIHTVVLRCQLQLDVTRRHYTPEEEVQLRDLFGAADRWSQTLRTMLWTHVSVVVPPFTGETRVDVPVPCTYDFNIGATKYFYGLTEGDIPVTVLFSGSVFYEEATGTLQVGPVSWDKEATFRLPVSTWRELMDHYYPNQAWLTLRRDAFDRLYRFKVERGIPTWEEAVEALLPPVAEEARA